MTVAEDLAAWSCSLRLSDVHPAAQRAACRHLLDGVGVALAAARAGAARPALLVALDLGGPPEAAVLGSANRIGAVPAAFANAVLVHALDFDDTHAESLVHPTAVVLPAVLAVGQQLAASGAEVLAAALVGYETVCRLGAGSPHGFHARGLHATAACGTFAAAAAAGRLLGLDEAQMVNALGIAGSCSGGLLEFLATGASTKQLHPGLASAAGVLAARLAQAGADGPASVVEGRHGLYASLSGRPADPARVTRGLGTDWEVTRITIKPYPACQLMHAALDATAIARQALDPSDPVVGAEAQIHPDSAAIVSEPAAEKANPKSSYDAKFSLPWSVAALLLDGSVSTDSYSDASIARPHVRALAQQITTSTLAPSSVAASAPATVVLRTASGARFAGSVSVSSGGPGRPLSDEAVSAKFIANVGGSDPAADELASRLLDLAHQTSLGPVHHLAASIASRGGP
jgi:2-methylcitrate dehydratase PrpD